MGQRLRRGSGGEVRTIPGHACLRFRGSLSKARPDVLPAHHACQVPCLQVASGQLLWNLVRALWRSISLPGERGLHDVDVEYEMTSANAAGRALFPKDQDRYPVNRSLAKWVANGTQSTRLSSRDRWRCSSLNCESNFGPLVVPLHLNRQPKTSYAPR